MLCSHCQQGGIKHRPKNRWTNQKHYTSGTLWWQWHRSIMAYLSWVLVWCCGCFNKVLEVLCEGCRILPLELIGKNHKSLHHLMK